MNGSVQVVERVREESHGSKYPLIALVGHKGQGKDQKQKEREKPPDGHQVMAIFFSSSNSSSIFPTPLATAVSGSSGTITGSPVSSLISKSRPLSRAPPPARTMPLSTMSAANSGGVF